MHDAVIFLNEDFEEIEALTITDVLRRGGVDTTLVSLTGGLSVTGSHAITVQADETYDAFIANGGANRNVLLVLPGGLGTASYKQHAPMLALLTTHHQAGGRIAAICAAPSILGMLGILNGKTATCFPGYEPELTGARIGYNRVETDGNIITANGAGSALPFALTALAAVKGTETADRVGKQMQYE